MRYTRQFALLRTSAIILAAIAIPGLAGAAQDASVQAPSAPAHAHVGQWGFDLTTRDLNIKPGTDFDRYASGAWLEKAEIPADKPSAGTFFDVYDLTQDQQKSLVMSAPATSKYGALYQSMMDEARVEALGLAPLKPDLAEIAAISDKTAFARYLGTTQGNFGISLFDWGISARHCRRVDERAQYHQAGLGLPNRDYYLKDEFKTQRDAYRAYIERTFKAIGEPILRPPPTGSWRSRPSSPRRAGRSPTGATSTRSTIR